MLKYHHALRRDKHRLVEMIYHVQYSVVQVSKKTNSPSNISTQKASLPPKGATAYYNDKKG
jgi:hypothetical protein